MADLAVVKNLAYIEKKTGIIIIITKFLQTRRFEIKQSATGKCIMQTIENLKN